MSFFQCSEWLLCSLPFGKKRSSVIFSASMPSVRCAQDGLALALRSGEFYVYTERAETAPEMVAETSFAVAVDLGWTEKKTPSQTTNGNGNLLHVLTTPGMPVVGLSAFPSLSRKSSLFHRLFYRRRIPSW